MAYDEDGNWVPDHDGSFGSLGPRWRRIVPVLAIAGGVIFVVLLLVAWFTGFGAGVWTPGR